MTKVFDFLKTCWSWFYERTVVWFIFAFFLLMGWGQLKKNELASEFKEENLNCRVQCLPMSSEFFQNQNGNQCWCYNDVNTLVKPQ